MKISYNWLKQFISVDWDAEKTGNLLTDLGLEVEGIEKFSSLKGGLEGVIVGHVISCIPHPNADRLKVTKVALGNGKEVQIVCGAANVAEGQNVPVATVGTTLYGADGKPWEINKGKIRGEVSEGMICAEDELGLGTSHEGIMVLATKLKPGTPLSQLFEIENDIVFEIGLTPNRADAMSHWGVARDLRAGLLQNGVAAKINTPSTSNFSIENRSLKIDVNVENPLLAPRYCGVTLSGLTITESPAWLKNRLKAIGISSINNVVDITNYVLHELGQPLHAFDAEKIEGKKVQVKTMPTGTKFTTLDGVERILDAEDLLICDAEKPMCLAGVFGGLSSGVTASTTSIFLESAYFNPISIRKTAKRHQLNTDASFRFERGIDPSITEYALKRAAILIQQVAGGKITSDIVDLYPKKIEDQQVFLHLETAAKLIGEQIPTEKIKEILTSLEIKIINSTETGIGMTIPAYRNDVTREIDVIEEILRVYGYNTIKFTQKLNASIASIKRVEDYKVQDAVASQLTVLGFHEMLANSLTSAKYASLSDMFSADQNIEMLNPLSQDLSVLRQSMLFGALETLSFNINRKNTSIKLFEFGKTYHKMHGRRDENKHLSLLISGDRNDLVWNKATTKTDFFYVKGIVTAILERLGIHSFSEEVSTNTLFSEGISLSKKNKVLVEFGLVNKKILKNFDIQADTLYADFNWDAVLSVLSDKTILFQPISKFPMVKRDFALLVDEAVTFNMLRNAALHSEKKLLKSVSLFDVYTGSNLPEGKKSYALNFTIQDQEKTLTDKQIDKIMDKLQHTFENEFGAILR